MDNNKLVVLVARLLKACQRLPDMGGDLWGRGVAVLERKFGIEMWLSKFEPSGMQPGEHPTATITIQPVDNET